MNWERLKRLRRPLEIVLILIVLFYLGRYGYQRWQEVQAVEFRLAVGPLLAGVLLLLVFYFIMASVWQRILRMINAYPEGVGKVSVHRAFMTAFLVRYLPGGNVMTVGGRVELLKRLGGARSLALESVYYEQLYLTVGAITLGLLSAPTLPWILLPGWLTAQASLLIVAVAIGTALAAAGPEMVVRLVVHLLGKADLEQLGTELQWHNKLELVLWFLVINVLQGVSAWAFMLAVYPRLPTTGSAMLLIVAAYPLARLLGQLVAVVPGGLGIREGAYVLLLTPLLPIQAVVVTAALVRLASVIVELLYVGFTVALEQGRELGLAKLVSRKKG